TCSIRPVAAATAVPETSNASQIPLIIAPPPRPAWPAAGHVLQDSGPARWTSGHAYETGRGVRRAAGGREAAEASGGRAGRRHARGLAVPRAGGVLRVAARRLLPRLQAKELGGVAVEDAVDVLVLHSQVVTGPQLVLQVAHGKAAGEPAGVRAEDDALRPHGLVELLEQVLQGQLAVMPPHPLVRPRRVDVHVGAAPHQVQQLPRVTATEVRDDER